MQPSSYTEKRADPVMQSKPVASALAHWTLDSGLKWEKGALTFKLGAFPYTDIGHTMGASLAEPLLPATKLMPKVKISWRF